MIRNVQPKSIYISPAVSYFYFWTSLNVHLGHRAIRVAISKNWKFIEQNYIYNIIFTSCINLNVTYKAWCKKVIQSWQCHCDFSMIFMANNLYKKLMNFNQPNQPETRPKYRFCCNKKSPPQEFIIKNLCANAHFWPHIWPKSAVKVGFVT